jgi:hypothetical protein
VLIHIGFHKTATSWLQQRWYPNHPQLAVPFDYWEIAERLVYPDPLHYDVAATRAWFNAGAPADRVTVLSAERLSGTPHAGGYDRVEIAERIAETFPDATVWIVVREQVAMIASLWRQYVFEGGRLSLDRYVRGVAPELKPGFRFEHLDYAPLVAHYRKRLGDDRVLVTTYEDFRRDPQPTLDRVCDLVGVEHLAPRGDERALVNRGLSDRSARVLRAVNAVSRFERMPEEPVADLRLRGPVARVLRKLDRAGTPWSASTGVEARVGELVGDRYDEPNRDLAHLLDVDLAALGYRCAS